MADWQLLLIVGVGTFTVFYAGWWAHYWLGRIPPRERD